MRIPIKATAHEPIKQAGYISATSAILQTPQLQNAAGPYIWVTNGQRGKAVKLCYALRGCWRVVRRRSSSCVLLHDIHTATVAQLDRFLRRLEAHGNIVFEPPLTLSANAVR